MEAGFCRVVQQEVRCTALIQREAECAAAFYARRVALLEEATRNIAAMKCHRRLLLLRLAWQQRMFQVVALLQTSQDVPR